MHVDVTLAMKQLRLRPSYATPLALPSGAATGTPLSQNPFAHVSNDLERPPHTVFQVPGIHLLPKLLLETSGLKPVYDSPPGAERTALATSLARSRFDACAEIARFAPFFNQQYTICRAPWLVDQPHRFTPAEDRLFAVGIRRCASRLITEINYRD